VSVLLSLAILQPGMTRGQTNLDEVPDGLVLPLAEQTKTLSEAEVAQKLPRRRAALMERYHQRRQRRAVEGPRRYDAPVWEDIERTLPDELRATLAEEAAR
jgi:hypothetical protein